MNLPFPYAFKDNKLPLAVIVAATNWTEPPRMRHDITQQLMRWCNVLFVEFFATGCKGEDGWRREGDRLLIYTPAMSFPVPVCLYANDPLTHTFVNKCYSTKIRRAVESLNTEMSLLFNFSWNFPEIIKVESFSYRGYICVDEFPMMHSRSNNWLKQRYQLRLFQSYENRVAKKADHCFTPHYLLRDKLLKVNKNVKMLFHAHSYEQNKNVGVGKKDRLIKVAFAGYIHYRLIDHWLEHLLEEKNIELYLIGPLNPQYSICELSKKQNFHFVPPLMANDLQRTLQEMNVLIIPYHPHLPETEVLTTVSKLYQYIASGKPVVLSNLPNFIEMPEGVLYKASSSENFVAKILQAHAEDCEEYRNLRAKIAAENTWDKRGEQLHALLKETLGDKIPELSQNAN